MDAMERRLEAIRLAIGHCNSHASADMVVVTADRFLAFIKGDDEPKPASQSDTPRYYEYLGMSRDALVKTHEFVMSNRHRFVDWRDRIIFILRQILRHQPVELKKAPDTSLGRQTLFADADLVIDENGKAYKGGSSTVVPDVVVMVNSQTEYASRYKQVGDPAPVHWGRDVSQFAKFEDAVAAAVKADI
jgi:hypothetical protein